MLEPYFTTVREDEDGDRCLDLLANALERDDHRPALAFQSNAPFPQLPYALEEGGLTSAHTNFLDLCC